MVQTRQDYLFVDCPQPLIVDGGIMPKRQDKGVLRAEDPLFMQEATLERALACATQSGVHTASHSVVQLQAFAQPVIDDHVDKHIIGARIQHVCEALQSMQPNFCRQWPQRPSRAPYWASESRSPGALIPETTSTQVQRLKSDAAMFATGQPLAQTPLQDVFDDLQTLQMPSIIVSQAEGATISCTASRPDPQYWGVYEGGLVKDRNIVYRDNELITNWGGYMTEGEYSIDIPHGPLTGQKGVVQESFVDEVRCFADFDYFVQKVNIPTPGSFEQHFWRVLVPIEGVLSTDKTKITFTAQAVSAAATQAHRDAGDVWGNPAMFAGDMQQQQIVTLTRLGAVMKLNDHTRW